MFIPFVQGSQRLKIGSALIFIAALGLLSCPATAQKDGWKLTPGQSIYPVAAHTDMQRHVLVHLPPEFERRTWPVIVYLHGSAQRGEPADELRKTAIARHLETLAEFPFIVVSPQLVADAAGWNPAAVHALLDEVLPRLPGDARKLYATGTSIGGSGVWSLAFERPTRFAAIAPVATAGRLRDPCRIGAAPVWAFHNARDEKFPAVNDSDLVNALQRCNGNARITLYPKAGHDAWTETYRNGALYKWFLSHSTRSTAQ